MPAHEAAHVRLGHPATLLAGAAIGRSYRWLPPARPAWDRLRRDIEADDDDEAAAVAGALLSALAKVALATAPLAGSPPARAGFADPEDLRYRIRRLQAPPASGARCALSLALGGAVLTGGLPAARRYRVAGPDPLPGRLRLPGLSRPGISPARSACRMTSSPPGSLSSPKVQTSLPTAAGGTACSLPTRCVCCGNAASPPGRWREGCPTGGSPGCPSVPGQARDCCHARRTPILRRPGGRHRGGEPASGEDARVTSAPPEPVVIDGGDRSCVALLLVLRRRICDLPAGTVIHLIASDPAASMDLPAGCHLTGHAYLGSIRAATPTYELRAAAPFATDPASP